jgi:FtsP/CotA-like multicopper oxidase with cupredoxin domain
MKRRRFLQLAACAAGGAVIRPASAKEVYMTVGARTLGPGALRVRAGDHVLFHFLHTGRSEDVSLHLPGHRFSVIALDGNPVPTRVAVDVLSLTAGERIDAMVEMNAPGNWLLSSLENAARGSGLGIVVTYEDHDGPPCWQAPSAIDWHYARFSAACSAAPEPDEVIEMLFEKQRIPNINDLKLHPRRRYRLRMMNATAGACSVRLNRRFELTRVNQIPVSGIFKDTARLEGYGVLDVDFAD